MELTKEILNRERLFMDELVSKSYSKDSQQYRDMMFAIDLYYQSLLRTLNYIIGED